MSRNRDRIREALKAGDCLFSDRKYAEAAAEYEKALRLHREALCEGDDCFRVHVKYGACLVRDRASDESKFKEAESFFEAALKFKSDDAGVRRGDEADAYRYWGDALNGLGRSATAAAKYAEAIARRPSYAEAYCGWGNALFFMGSHEQALRKYKEALRYQGDYSRALFNSGVVLCKLRQFDRAAAKYERLVEIWKRGAGHNGNNGAAAEALEDAVSAYVNWGSILAMQGEYESAALKLTEAARLGVADDYGEAHIMYNNWGDALFHLGRYDEAVDKFKESQRRKPDYPYAFHNEAFVYWQEGRYREARRVGAKAAAHYEKAREGRKAAGDALFFRSCAELLHKILGGTEAAEKDYLTALEIDPKDVDAAVGLIFLYAEMREEMCDLDRKAAAYWKSAELAASARHALEESVKKFEREAAGRKPNEPAARRAQRGSASALYNLGRLSLAAKEYDDAEARLLKAVAADPGRAEPHADLGVLYARKEDYKRAVRHFESSLERDPNNLSVRSNLAEAHRQLKEIDKAEREYKRILDVTDCHVESHIGLGEVYVEMGDDGNPDMYEEAISNFDKGLAVSKLECASKRLKKKEEAAVYYARGYARVRLYESLKLNKDEEHLRRAWEDFATAYACDNDLHKAKRAKEKVEPKLWPPAGQFFTKTLGPGLIFVLAFAAFALAQANFFAGWPRPDPAWAVSATGYALSSFGALMFMLASLSLPQLLKFKVAGVELEKSSIDQVAIPEYFKLSKPE